MTAEAAARLRGAAEALDMLDGRPPAARRSASRYGVALLLRHAAPADWGRSGLPLPQGQPYRQLPRGTGGVPLSDRSVMRLAEASMTLYCAELRVTDQPWHWAWLARFFADYVPAADPGLADLRARASRAAGSAA